MKTLLLIVCCLAGGALAPSPEETIARIVDPITSLAKVKDASYECSRSCLIETVKQVYQLMADSDIKKLKDQKEIASLALKLVCEANAKGKDCLNNCPKGNLEGILVFISDQLAYACEKSEGIKELLNAIPVSMNSDTCGNCGGKDIPILLQDSLFNPQNVIDAEKTCQSTKCTADCVSKLISEAGFEEGAKLYLELAKRMMRVVVAIHIIRNDGVKPPPDCDWVIQ